MDSAFVDDSNSDAPVDFNPFNSFKEAENFVASGPKSLKPGSNQTASTVPSLHARSVRYAFPVASEASVLDPPSPPAKFRTEIAQEPDFTVANLSLSA